MDIRAPFASVLLLVSTYSLTQVSSDTFHGVEEWKDSLTTTAIISFKDLYSTEPPAMYMTKGVKPVLGALAQALTSP
jgi:hypothetical protein